MNPTLPMDPLHRARRFGWWSLLVWLSLGMVLEALHGFKIGWYLDANQEMRRLMVTLAHAHGTLLGLVNIAAGLTLRLVKGFEVTRAHSLSLLWGSGLLPAGFFLCGIIIHAGDPGLGVLLVPVGALLLLYAVWGFARTLSRIK